MLNDDVFGPDDVKVPILLFCGDFPPLGLYSPKLCLMSPPDRDFAWLVDTLVALGSNENPSGVSAFKGGDGDLIAQFSFLSPEVFTVGMYALQHACVRYPQLSQVIERGVELLYAQYFHAALKMEEERIIGALRLHGLPPDVVIESFEKAMPDPVTRVTYMKIFISRQTQRNSGALTPEFIVKVPWTQALTLVGSREAIFMENGLVYLDYTMVATWMRGRWKKGVSEWKEWDAVNVIMPICERARQQLHSDIPRRSWAQHDESRYYKLIGQTENEKIYRPLIERMKRDHFLPFDQDDVDPTDASLHVMTGIYRGILERLEEVDKQRNRLRRARYQQEVEASSTFVPTVVDDGKLQIEGYAKIMPPCINKIYRTNVTAHTHFKHDERLKFFQWAYKAGLSLEVTTEAWASMLDNDMSVSGQFRASLINIPREIYTKELKNEIEDRAFNFFGCAKMSDYCPFVDIEDINDRLGKCVTTCCTSVPTSTAMVMARRWSPMNATTYFKK